MEDSPGSMEPPQGSTTTKADNTAEAGAALDSEKNGAMKELLEKAVGHMLQGDHKSVAYDNLVASLHEDRVKSRDCAQFPFMIAFFIMFALMVLAHENISDVSQVERNFRGMIEGTSFEGTLPIEHGGHFVSGHKTLEDVDVITDIYTWLQDAILPLFIPNLATARSADMNRVLRYSQLIGGVQLQQIRRRKVSCTDEYPHLGPKAKGTDVNPLLVNFACYPAGKYTKDCFGGETLSDKPGFCPDSVANSVSAQRLLAATDAHGFHTYDMVSSIFDTTSAYLASPIPSDDVNGSRRLQGEKDADGIKGQSFEALMGLSSFKGGMYSVTIHEHEGLAGALQTVADLKANNWLDVETAWFGLKMFILNPDLGVYTHIIANVWFPLSGMLIPSVTMSSFPAEPYQYKSTWGLDGAWFVLWFHLFVTSAIGLATAKKKKQFKKYVATFWNWLDWFTIIAGGVIIALWFGGFLSSLTTIKARAMEVVLGRPSEAADGSFAFASDQNAFSYTSDVETLQREVATLSGFLVMYRLFICWYTIIIMMRFFKAFLAQPKLAVVTNTVLRSLPDVAHFLIVLLLVFFAYSVAGMFLFGHRMLIFSELKFALFSCFLIMLGNFDFAELSEEHLFSACIWFFTFMIIVALIMLNMFLAIIMDIYTEVKMVAADQEPIWTQAADMIGGLISKRTWIKVSMIQEAVEDWPDHPDKIDLEVLMEKVPMLGKDQAHDVLEKTYNHEMADMQSGLTISDAMKMVGWIKIAMQKIAKRIEEIMFTELLERKAQNKLHHDDSLQQALTPRKWGETPAQGSAAEQAQQLAISQKQAQQQSLVEMAPPELVRMDPVSMTRLGAVDRRLGRMEEFLNESMCFMVHRGKEMRNRVNIIESLLQGTSAPAEAPPDSSRWSFGAGAQNGGR
jgi:hypothetical protein